MEAIDRDYIADSYIEAFSICCDDVIKYIPLDNELTGTDKTGKIKPVYKEDFGVIVYGIYSVKVPQYNPDISDENSSKKQQQLDIVIKQLRDSGIVPKIGDKVEITSPYGETQVFVVIGFDRQIEHPNIINRLIINDEKHAVI
jgi:hypothetical protein